MHNFKSLKQIFTYLLQPSTFAPQPRRCLASQQQWSGLCWVSPLSKTTPLYTPRRYFYGNTESGCFQLCFLDKTKNKDRSDIKWISQPICIMYQRSSAMLNYLDKSYSTFLLISEDADMGIGWGTWCVYSPGGHRYKCKGCIPGLSPKLGATCLHGSMSCHCINMLSRNGKHLSVGPHTETIMKLQGTCL